MNLTRMIILSMVLSWLPSSAFAQRALLIGIDEYQHHEAYLEKKSKKLNLNGCVADARAFAKTIESNFDFDASDIKLLLNEAATHDNILAQIDGWLVSETVPGEIALLFYSGHGFLMKQSGGMQTALCPSDTNPFTLEKLLMADALGKRLSALQGRTLMVIVDACHSAAVLRSPTKMAHIGARARFFPVEQPAEETGTLRMRSLSFFDEIHSDKIFLAACAPTEKAWELPIEGRTRGVFTHALISELTRHEGKIDSSTIQRLATDYIGSYELPQHPQLKSNSMLEKALWRDLLVKEPQSQLAALVDPAPPFKVDVWVGEKNKRAFNIGDRLVFKAKSEASGYLYLLDIAPDKNVTLLFPNHWDRDNFVAAGATVTVPSDRFNSEFIASAPKGIDTVIAVVSTQRWQALEDIRSNPDDVLSVLDSDQIRKVVGSALTRSPLRDPQVRQTAAMDAREKAATWALGKVEIKIQ